MIYIFKMPLSNIPIDMAIDFEKRLEMLKWAKKHCPSYIMNDVDNTDVLWYYRFYFSHEKDYLMFILRWA